jgi:hypothetical protein
VSDVTLLIMSGIHPGGSEAEMMMAHARRAITQDIVERAAQVPGLSRIVLSTNDAWLADWGNGCGVSVELDPPDIPFHFGQRLRDLMGKIPSSKVLYMGGGSGALLTTEEITDIVNHLAATDRTCITNNLYSTDFAGFTPAAAVQAIEPPSIDNDLSWLLVHQAGLPVEILPRRASTQFDVDTPTDVLILSYHPNAGKHVCDLVYRQKLNRAHIERVLPVLTDHEAEIVIAGRASASVWEDMERETFCRVRGLAEERGMRASGRQARGLVRSLLGYYYQEVGARHFFEALASLGQGIILDSRVLFAHLHTWPSARDRYHSDLLQPDKIADPVVREFTAAALSCPVPVVLGGHSLVSGGLYALVEAARSRVTDATDSRSLRPTNR